MRKLVLCVAVVIASAPLAAHDLLFRLDNYFVEPGAKTDGSATHESRWATVSFAIR